MERTEICPVCKGVGELTADKHSMDTPKKTCHGCDGKGWVRVLGKRIKRSDILATPGVWPQCSLAELQGVVYDCVGFLQDEYDGLSKADAIEQLSKLISSSKFEDFIRDNI